MITVLNKTFIKRKFNANNTVDLQAYKYFLDNQKWGKDGCPFELEWPWLSIPDMINHKIAESAVALV